MEKEVNIDLASWWDPREKGTIANFAAKVLIVGVMLNFVTDRAIDYSSAKVDGVVDSKTMLIREDIQKPMDNVQDQVDEAVASVENIENGVEQIKTFFQEEFGIDFDKVNKPD